MSHTGNDITEEEKKNALETVFTFNEEAFSRATPYEQVSILTLLMEFVYGKIKAIDENLDKLKQA